MIKSLRLQNFFSFEDETIAFHPEVNVMVGINGSGKSNVLKAFKLLQEGMAGRLRELINDRWGGIDAIRFKGADADKRVEIQVTVELADVGQEFEYCILIGKERNTSNYHLEERIPLVEVAQTSLWRPTGMDYATAKHRKSESLKIAIEDLGELALSKIAPMEDLYFQNRIRAILSDVVVYDYFDTTPRSSIRRPVLATSGKRLFPDGANLAQIINTLKIGDKTAFKAIVSQLSRINPNFSEIDFNVLGGNIELMLGENGFNTSVHVTHISDGTLRFLCLMAIFFNKNRGSFVCIDEPELGLHPDMLKAVYDAMAEAGKETQFLISTHSDNLLDMMDIENIRVVEKDDQNASRVKALDPKKFEGWYENFSPGNMWRNGDFGGNRF